MPNPSGKFVLRLPPELHAELKSLAHAEGLSLNSVCEEMIRIGLSGSGDNTLFIKIERAARKRYGEGFIGLILFGSTARGEAHEGSDIDLLVVLADELPIVRKLYQDWEGELPEKVSIHFSHVPKQLPGSLWLECALDGRIISDRQNKLARVISEVKELITSGRFVRKTTHGQGYWVAI